MVQLLSFKKILFFFHDFSASRANLFKLYVTTAAESAIGTSVANSVNHGIGRAVFRLLIVVFHYLGKLCGTHNAKVATLRRMRGVSHYNKCVNCMSKRWKD